MRTLLLAAAHAATGHCRHDVEDHAGFQQRARSIISSVWETLPGLPIPGQRDLL